MQELVELSRKYFLRTGDRQSRVWIFQPDQPSPFLRSSAHFGDDKFGIGIIDLFAGLQPLLLNYDAFTHDEIKIPFRPTVVLDSNVVSYLHQYVTSKSSLIPQRRDAVLETLRFLISNRLDYNPFFYYMEGAAKDQNGTLLKYAQDISRTILTLHTMDDNRFLESGNIMLDPSRLEIYAQEFGAKTIEEIAPLYARAMVCPTDPETDWLSRLSYAALLKIGLIHKKNRQGIAEKYEEFRSFMQEELNVALGMERMLALGYFAGQFDKFIPIQRGANIYRILKRLHAAAWDLLLLKLPARLLVTGKDDEIVLGYICTSDRALTCIGQACKIESVMGLAPEGNKPIPFMAYDLSSLQKKVSPEVIATITARDKEWQRSRLPNLTDPGERISFEKLPKLISDMEAEVRNFCKT